MTKRDIRVARLQINDGVLSERLGKARSWQARVEEDLARLEEKLLAILHDYHEDRESWIGKRSLSTEPPRRDEEAAAKGHRMLIGAWAARILEALFAGALAAVALALPLGWAVLIGVAVALLMALMMEGAAMRLLRKGTPLQGLHAAERWVGFTFVIAVLALAPLAVARTVEEAAVLTGPSLAILTLMLPMLGAALGAAAFLLMSSERFTRVYERLLLEKAETEQFRRELIDFVSEAEDGRPSFDRSRHNDTPEGGFHAIQRVRRDLVHARNAGNGTRRGRNRAHRHPA